MTKMSSRNNAILLAVAVAACFCCTAAQAQSNNVTYSKVYSTFYAGVSVTPDATICKQIIDTLGLRGTMNNPRLALTVFVPSDTAFKTLASKLGLPTTTMSSNVAVMKQVLYYHFVTGPAGGPFAVMHTGKLVAGQKLDTMFLAPATRKPFQLTVTVAANATTAAPRVQVKSVGTTANVFRPNIKCGAGVAHGIDAVLVPAPLALVKAMM